MHVAQVFGTTRIPGESVDSLRTHTVGRDGDGHVLLIVGKALFKLYVATFVPATSIDQPPLPPSPYRTISRCELPRAFSLCFSSVAFPYSFLILVLEEGRSLYASLRAEYRGLNRPNQQCRALRFVLRHAPARRPVLVKGRKVSESQLEAAIRRAAAAAAAGEPMRRLTRRRPELLVSADSLPAEVGRGDSARYPVAGRGPCRGSQRASFSLSPSLPPSLSSESIVGAVSARLRVHRLADSRGRGRRGAPLPPREPRSSPVRATVVAGCPYVRDTGARRGTRPRAPHSLTRQARRGVADEAAARPAPRARPDMRSAERALIRPLQPVSHGPGRMSPDGPSGGRGGPGALEGPAFWRRMRVDWAERMGGAAARVPDEQRRGLEREQGL